MKRPGTAVCRFSLRPPRATLPLLLVACAPFAAAGAFERENERKQYEYEQGQRNKQIQSQRDYLRRSDDERGQLSETEKALMAQQEEERARAANEAAAAAAQREAAKLKAKQFALDAAAYAKRKAAEDAANRAHRASRLQYLTTSKARPDSEAELCRIALGVHPDFGYTESDVTPLTEPAVAQQAVATALSNHNAEVIRLMWRLIVVKDLTAPRFKPNELGWRQTLAPTTDTSPRPPEQYDYNWFIGSLADRVLSLGKLYDLSESAYAVWHWRIGYLLQEHPEYLPRLTTQYGDTLRERFLAGHTPGATGDDAKRLELALKTYVTLRSGVPASADEEALTRRAADLAAAAASPAMMDTLLLAVDPARRWPAWRARLAEPNPAFIRHALHLAATDPELLALRRADPALTAADTPLRGPEPGLPKLLTTLAMTDSPFDPAGDNDALVTQFVEQLGDVPHAPRLFEILAAKAAAAKIEPVGAQLNLVRAGLALRAGGRLDVQGRPVTTELAATLRAWTVRAIPGNRIAYDTLLTFTAEQAATCARNPDTSAGVKSILQALAGFGSGKAAAALRLLGETPTAAPTTTGPTELPL